MKKWIFMLLLAGSIQGIYAQKTEKKEKFNPNTPLFEELTDVKKKTDKFNLYLNMQGSFDAHFQNGFQEGDFNMHQLRIEAKGNINNWLSYRYRQRLNRSNDANGMIDNLPTSIDYAGIGIKLNDQFSLFAILQVPYNCMITSSTYFLISLLYGAVLSRHYCGSFR